MIEVTGRPNELLARDIAGALSSYDVMFVEGIKILKPGSISNNLYDIVLEVADYRTLIEVSVLLKAFDFRANSKLKIKSPVAEIEVEVGIGK